MGVHLSQALLWFYSNNVKTASVQPSTSGLLYPEAKNCFDTFCTKSSLLSEAALLETIRPGWFSALHCIVNCLLSNMHVVDLIYLYLSCNAVCCF